VKLGMVCQLGRRETAWIGPGHVSKHDHVPKGKPYMRPSDEQGDQGDGAAAESDDGPGSGMRRTAHRLIRPEHSTPPDTPASRASDHDLGPCRCRLESQTGDGLVMRQRSAPMQVTRRGRLWLRHCPAASVPSDLEPPAAPAAPARGRPCPPGRPSCHQPRLDMWIW
jgi:hypothetical protein